MLVEFFNSSATIHSKTNADKKVQTTELKISAKQEYESSPRPPQLRTSDFHFWLPERCTLRTHLAQDKELKSRMCEKL
jgi:hypothetical protein